jgi:hypothetical protein
MPIVLNTEEQSREMQVQGTATQMAAEAEAVCP